MNASIQRISGVFFRHLYAMKHCIEKLIDAFYYPVIDLVLWGSTTYWVSQNGDQASDILLAMLSAIVFWQIFWRGNYDVSVNMLIEIWSENITNIFGSPLKPREWIVAVMLVGFAKSLMALAAGSLFAWLLYSSNIFTLGFHLIPFYGVLIISGWIMGMLTSSLVICYGSRIGIMAWMSSFALLPFSAVYYPVEVLPVWMQYVAMVNPVSYVFEGMREVIYTGVLSEEKLYIAYSLSLVYIALAMTILDRMFIRSRENGLVNLK